MSEEEKKSGKTAEFDWPTIGLIVAFLGILGVVAIFNQPKLESSEWEGKPGNIWVYNSIFVLMVVVVFSYLAFNSEGCRHSRQNARESASQSIKLSSGITLTPGKTYFFNLSGGQQSSMQVTEKSGKWLKGTYANKEVVVKIDAIESVSEYRRSSGGARNPLSLRDDP